uniref:PNPLA domain-containing protein n=1 Tax=Amazona collaria TaxID=241587 RepID=A0A8B9GFJ8_9PSIT
MKRNGNERRPFSILMLESASKIYGSSSGSLIGCGMIALLCFALDKVKMTFYNNLRPSFWGLHLGGRILNVVKDILNDFLPPNAHQLVAGRLHVIVTHMSDCRSVVVSEFASKEELIQVLLCSCFIPFCFGLFPPMYRGVVSSLVVWKHTRAKGPSRLCPFFMSRTTITMSAFTGEFDICPKDCPAAFLNFQLSDSVPSALTATSPLQVMDQYYACGYQDTVSYLKRLSKCLRVRSM